MTVPPDITTEALLEQLMADIGTAVVQAQLAEDIIRHTLLYVLPGRPMRTLKAFLKAEAALTKITLGTMTKTLRERTELHPRFDAVMTRFVEDRNTLIHHVKNVPGFNGHHRYGYAQARAWVTSFSGLCHLVIRVFSALMISYTKGRSADVAPPQSIRDFVGEDLVGLIDEFFMPKSSHEGAEWQL